MADIYSFFNSNCIKCPKCMIPNPFSLKPINSNIQIRTPEDVWTYIFSCDDCQGRYELKEIAIKSRSIMEYFGKWFQREFPGQPLPWGTQTSTSTPVKHETELSLADFETKFKERRDRHMRKILGF